METGVLLRNARKRSGMTLGDLATQVGLSPATLSRAETGQGTLTEERLRLCAHAMGLDVEDLRAIGAVSEPISDQDVRHLASAFVPGEPGCWRHYDPLVLPPALEAALASFLDLGYHGTSVREIAARAGLSVPGLYHHYACKHDLLVAILDLTMQDFRDRCIAARAEGRTARERFTLLVECGALFHSHRRELAFIGASEMRSLQEPHHSRIVEMRNECQRMLDEEVCAMVAERAAFTTLPEDAARAVVTMLVGIANWYRIEGVLAPEEIARRYVLHASALVQAVEA